MRKKCQSASVTQKNENLLSINFFFPFTRASLPSFYDDKHQSRLKVTNFPFIYQFYLSLCCHASHSLSKSLFALCFVCKVDRNDDRETIDDEKAS